MIQSKFFVIILCSLLISDLEVAVLICFHKGYQELRTILKVRHDCLERIWCHSNVSVLTGSFSLDELYQQTLDGCDKLVPGKIGSSVDQGGYFFWGGKGEVLLVCQVW